MKLLNVRLGPEDARMAATLRQHGVQVSRVVRQAIRAEYARRLAGRAQGRRASDIVVDIYAAHPDPADLPPREYDVHDRQGARRAIRKRLGRGCR